MANNNHIDLDHFDFDVNNFHFSFDVVSLASGCVNVTCVCV